VDCERWLALTGTPEANADEIRAALRSELTGGPPTGMRPFERRGGSDGAREDSLWFTQRWVVVISRKPG
jgi:hypothetical protein